MAETYETASVTMEQVQCCANGCGIVFMVPKDWAKRRRGDHQWFCCPNGHNLNWPQRSKEEELRDQLAREKHNAEQAQAHANHLARRLTVARRQRAAARGQVTKIKNRVGRGVCPCCNRTFANVAAHMQNQHPEWAASTTDPNTGRTR